MEILRIHYGDRITLHTELTEKAVPKVDHIVWTQFWTSENDTSTVSSHKLLPYGGVHPSKTLLTSRD